MSTKTRITTTSAPAPAHTFSQGVRKGPFVQVSGQGPVDAATVYMAARGLVGALLDDLAQATGRDLDEIVGPWLVSLEVREALAEVDVGG